MSGRGPSPSHWLSAARHSRCSSASIFPSETPLPSHVAAPFMGLPSRPSMSRPRRTSNLPPGSPVTLDESVGLLRTPRSGFVVREFGRWLLLPALDDTVDQPPLRLNL